MKVKFNFNYIIMIVISILFIALLILADCRWYAFAIYCAVFFLCVFLNKYKNTKKIYSYTLLTLTAVLMMLFMRINLRISLIGTISSSVIDIYMENFDREKYYIVDEKSWQIPDGYSNTKYSLSKSSMEILKKTNNGNHNHIIYQLHGGSYIRPIANEYRDLAVQYSKYGKNSDVATLDYRTAPQYVYPAALEDAVEGYEFLLKRGYSNDNIIISGDSAGGNLTLALTEYLRDKGYALPKAVIVMSPWADLSEGGESYKYNLHKDIMFGVKDGCTLNGYAIDNRYAGSTNLHDKYLSPVYADYKYFPSMLIQAGTYEMLESDSKTINKKAENSGVNVKLTLYNGMFHQFQLYGFLPESKKAWNEIRGFINTQWC